MSHKALINLDEGNVRRLRQKVNVDAKFLVALKIAFVIV
jgi:hypothetical protein